MTSSHRLHQKKGEGMLRIALMALAGSLLLTTSALASGFGIFVQGAKGLGQANAVIAHAAGASTVYFNPALMPLLERPSGFEVGTTVVKSERSFTSASTGAETDGKDNTYFPSSLYYYRQLPQLEDVWFGLAVNSTFGLGTEWPTAWEGRYIATKNEVTTFNINPNVAWKMGNQWSAAVGLDALYFKLDSNRMIPAIFLIPGEPDPAQQAKGDTWALGFNAALAWRPLEKLCLGLSYRSKFDINLNAGDLDVNFNNVSSALAPFLQNTTAATKFTLPQQLTLGVAYDILPELTLEVGARWEDWAQYGNTVVTFTNPVAGQPSDTILRDWKSTWAYNLGGEYRFSPRWSLLAGVLYSKTCVPDATFDPSIPDSDATLYTLGGAYTGGNWTFDFAYGLQDHTNRHKNNQINLPSVILGQPANGKYENVIHLVAASVGYNF